MSTGLIDEPLTYGCNVLAASQTFRQLVGATDAADAMGRCHAVEAIDLDEQQKEPPPRAIVAWAQPPASERMGSATYDETGTVAITIELLVPETEYQDRRGATRWVNQQAQQVLKEIQELGEAGGPAGTPYLIGTTYAVAGIGEGIDEDDPTQTRMLDGKAVYGALIEVEI